MKLVVVSPPDDRARESDIVQSLFAAGLVRYHLRKPTWSPERTEDWLGSLPTWRSRIVVHRHHDVARRLGAGGIHFRDDATAPTTPKPQAAATFVSRSCHDVATVRAALGHYSAVFVGPLFTSLSKPGYGPMPDLQRQALCSLLASRTPVERQTDVIAIGGITRDTLADCFACGFDGAAVLGVVWDTPDPVAAYATLREAVSSLTASRTERTP